MVSNTQILKVGEVLTVEVVKICDFGAVVILPNKKQGLIHISQISDDFVKDVSKYLKVGDKVAARIKKIASNGKIDLTLKKDKKKKIDTPKYLKKTVKVKEFKNSLFSDKMDEFLKTKKIQ